MLLLPGKTTMRMKTQKPDCPHKPSGLAQRHRSLMAKKDDEQREFTSGQKTDVTMCFLPSPDSPSPTDKPQVTSKTFSGSFDDLDIPYIDEDEDEDLT